MRFCLHIFVLFCWLILFLADASRHDPPGSDRVSQTTEHHAVFGPAQGSQGLFDLPNAHETRLQNIAPMSRASVNGQPLTHSLPELPQVQAHELPFRRRMPLPKAWCADQILRTVWAQHASTSLQHLMANSRRDFMQQRLRSLEPHFQQHALPHVEAAVDRDFFRQTIGRLLQGDVHAQTASHRPRHGPGQTATEAGSNGRPAVRAAQDDLERWQHERGPLIADASHSLRQQVLDREWEAQRGEISRQHATRLGRECKPAHRFPVLIPSLLIIPRSPDPVLSARRSHRPVPRVSHGCSQRPAGTVVRLAPAAATCGASSGGDGGTREPRVSHGILPSDVRGCWIPSIVTVPASRSPPGVADGAALRGSVPFSDEYNFNCYSLAELICCMALG